MIGSPRPTNGASAMIAVPAPHRASADQPSADARRPPATVHSKPATETNQTSTDRSTCATSATRKKLGTGNHWLM